MKRSIHKESSSVSNESRGSPPSFYYDVTRMLQIFSAFASLAETILRQTTCSSLNSDPLLAQSVGQRRVLT